MDNTSIELMRGASIVSALILMTGAYIFANKNPKLLVYAAVISLFLTLPLMLIPKRPIFDHVVLMKIATPEYLQSMLRSEQEYEAEIKTLPEGGKARRRQRKKKS